MNKMRVLAGVLIAVIITLVVGCASPSTTPHTEQTHFCIDGETVVGGDGEPIELINNPDATNPTYAELVAFLKNDPTDTYLYISGPPKNAFIDSDFAETVHNNAEAAGIRAAWVRVDFENGTSHALNAFETTDRGLIFTDSTGPEVRHQRGYDCRVYVEIGQPYGGVWIGDPLTIFFFFIHVGWVSNHYIAEGLSPRLQEETWQTLIEKGWTYNTSWQESCCEDPEKFVQLHAQMLEMHDQRDQQTLEWLKKYDVEELGTEWMNEWLQQHKGELYDFTTSHVSEGLMCFKPESEVYCRPEDYYTIHSGWRVDTDAVYPPKETVTIEEKVIMMDGVPVLWQISRDSCFPATSAIVKAVHIQW